MAKKPGITYDRTELDQLKTEHKKNLRKLGMKLRDYVFPWATFDMGRFSEGSEHGETECGSVGCAIGHGPYCGFPKRKNEDWIFYTRRIFGLDPYIDDKAFDYLFGGSHVFHKSGTQYNTACRILDFLENGMVEGRSYWYTYQNWPDESEVFDLSK